MTINKKFNFLGGEVRFIRADDQEAFDVAIREDDRVRLQNQKTPLGLDPIDAKLIADLRAHTELMRRGMRIFDSLPIDMQERIMHEIQKQSIADIVEAKEARRSAI